MASDLFENTYNPDILTCLANLSNDEVFTPPSVVNDMLDLLPQKLFRDPKTKFLDPVCKSGVFLREIAKRLIKGLEDEFPNLQERLDHIYKEQLFGIAITELTSLLSRRSLYCSKAPNRKYSVVKFDDIQGNIRFKNTEHRFKDGHCVYCGASEKTFGPKKRPAGMESHAYEFIHTIKPEEIWNMKFDVIIGNPPYQLDDGGNSASASPLYHFFVEQAQKLNPRYLSMIIPARWYAGGKGLDAFRKKMLRSDSISTLVDIPNSQDCFPGVMVAGGVCYFLWERDYHGLCKVLNVKDGNVVNSSIRSLGKYDVFIRNNSAISIIEKIQKMNETMMSSLISSRNPFGLPTNFEGRKERKSNDLTVYSSDGIQYVSPEKITDRFNLVSKYKVIITRAMSGSNKPTAAGEYMVIPTSIRVLIPGEICSDTYICVGAFDNRGSADRLLKYMTTKFFRYLLLQTLSSINITKEKFEFVPIQDFSKEWSDQQLYSKYQLTSEEIALIEAQIKPMNI